MMAARDWLAGVTDKGGKPPAGIAPTDTKGVLAAGNNCAARIAVDGKIDKDKIKLLIAAQIEINKKALSVAGKEGSARLRRDMNYLASFR